MIQCWLIIRAYLLFPRQREEFILVILFLHSLDSVSPVILLKVGIAQTSLFLDPPGCAVPSTWPCVMERKVTYHGSQTCHFPLIPPLPPASRCVRLPRSTKSCKTGASEGAHSSSAVSGMTGAHPCCRACSNSRIVCGACAESSCTVVKRSMKA